MTYKPDEIDRKILRLLQQDARLGIMEMVPLICLSKTPLAARVRKLRDLGFIKAYQAILDREKLERPVLVITHVKLDKQTAEQLDEFEHLMDTLPEVQLCVHVSGQWNFILHVSALSPQDYYQFLMSRINGLPNVAHTDSAFVLKESKIASPLPI